MVGSHDAFGDWVLQQPGGLIVAVVGPGLSDNPDSWKRIQIRSALREDGHKPFFPEDFVASDPAGESILAQERAILSRPDVDLN